MEGRDADRYLTMNGRKTIDYYGCRSSVALVTGTCIYIWGGVLCSIWSLGAIDGSSIYTTLAC